jgi:hypothetical protein
MLHAEVLRTAAAMIYQTDIGLTCDFRRERASEIEPAFSAGKPIEGVSVSC